MFRLIYEWALALPFNFGLQAFFIIFSVFTIEFSFSFSHNRNRFKQIDNLKKQNVQTGGVAVIKHDSRFVYYLITKDKAYQKPTYKDLSLSLHAMREHMVKSIIIFI